MANKWISEMSFPTSIANIFAARYITTAKEALSLTEFELMELLDVGLDKALGGGIPFGVLIELFKKDDRNWVKEFPRNIPCGRNGKGKDVDGKSRVSNEDQPLSFRTTTAKSVYLWIVKPQTVAKSNEMFLPGRMVFIFNMEGGFSSDILHRSKVDCPVSEEMVTVSDGSVLD
ncbi:hypothetical protein AAG906_020686 [Vitis piasezkii]